MKQVSRAEHFKDCQLINFCQFLRNTCQENLLGISGSVRPRHHQSLCFLFLFSFFLSFYLFFFSRDDVSSANRNPILLKTALQSSLGRPPLHEPGQQHLRFQKCRIRVGWRRKLFPVRRKYCRKWTNFFLITKLFCHANCIVFLATKLKLNVDIHTISFIVPFAYMTSIFELVESGEVT